MGPIRKKLILSLVLICFVISLGTAGYMLLEGWSLLDSVYMTIITLSSVGFKEVHDVSVYGRIFTLFLIIGGVGTVAYTLSTRAKLIVEGELQEVFGRKRLEKKISELKNHYIVCGFGRMGKIICKELIGNNIRFVIAEKDPSAIHNADDLLIYAGDATNDDTL